MRAKPLGSFATVWCCMEICRRRGWERLFAAVSGVLFLACGSLEPQDVAGLDGGSPDATVSMGDAGPGAGEDTGVACGSDSACGESPCPDVQQWTLSCGENFACPEGACTPCWACVAAEVVAFTEEADVVQLEDTGGEVFALGGGDMVIGGRGADVIHGGPGNDVLIGGKGGDVLIGGWEMTS